MEQLKSWSYSRLSVFEQCAYRAKLQWIDKIPDPHPKEAADRGTRIHQLGEDFVSGKLTTLPPQLVKFEDEFRKLRSLYEQNLVELEGEWGFDKDWLQTDWLGAWLRVKCDAVVWYSPKELLVIDYKTGKRFNNEIKHGEQTMLYAAAAAARHPEVEFVYTELWYLDVDELAYVRYTRQQALAALARFDKRGNKVTDEQRFAANPTQYNCKWCPYKETGDCSVGVS